MVKLIVELLSKAFEQLPDAILFVWLPKLISTLQQEKTPYIQQIIKEAALIFPKNSTALGNWQPSWEQVLPKAAAEETIIEEFILNEEEQNVRLLLQKHQETADSIAKLMEFPPVATSTKLADLSSVGVAINKSEHQVIALLKKHPESVEAIAAFI